MRVTIAHNKSIDEVKSRVDQSMVQVFSGAAGGPLQIVDPQKSWNGNTMNFALTAKMGFFTAPIRGTVEVTDKDLTIDADLGILDKIIGEGKTRDAIAERVRGLLSAPKA